MLRIPQAFRRVSRKPKGPANAELHHGEPRTHVASSTEIGEARLRLEAGLEHEDKQTRVSQAA